MSHGLQDIMGEAGRLRAECGYLLRLLDDLESLTSDVHYLSEAEHGEVMSLNSIYSRSAEENLPTGRNRPVQLVSRCRRCR